MDRRAFLEVIGFLGSIFGSAKALLGLQTGTKLSGAGLTYEQIRQKLSGSRIYIVPYAHSDFAYAHSRQWQAGHDDLIINEVLDVLRENPDYRWFLDTKNEELDGFLSRSPQRLDELKQRVKEGKIGVSGGTICSPDPNLMAGEAFIWNMVLGRRYFEQNFPGVNLDAMTQYDVCAGYTQVPQLLVKGGYQYYRFYRPEAALNAKRIPREFRWKGLDGTEIVCSRGTYAILKSPLDIRDDFAEKWEPAVQNFYERILASVAETANSGLLCVGNGGDETRPLRASLYQDPREPQMKLAEFVREWNKREKSRMQFATPLEFFRDLETKREHLPVVQGVLEPVGWSAWYGLNGNDGLQFWGACANEVLVSAQKGLALSALFGDPYPEEALAGLWLKLLRTSSHAQSFLYEEDYRNQLGLVKRVVEESGELEEEGLQRVAARIRMRSPREALVVFNPLPWERRDVVRLQPTFLQGDTENVQVRDAHGNLLPSQLEGLSTYDSELYLKEGDLWVEVTVPPLGYTTLYVEKQPGRRRVLEETQPSLTLGSEDFHVHVGPNGLPTLQDARQAVTYEDAGEVIYQVVKIEDVNLLHYGPIVRQLRLEDAAVQLRQVGPVRWLGEVTGRLGPHDLKLRIAVYPSVRRVEYGAEIDSRGGDGLFLATVKLPFSGQLVADVPFGVEPRDLSKEPYGETAADFASWSLERLRRNVFYAGRWVDVSDGQRGLTLVGTQGEKGFIYYPEERRLGHYLLQTTTPYQKGYEQYFNHYVQGKGQHVFSYSLLPHAGNWKEAKIPRKALEVACPLRAVSLDRRLPSAQQLLPESHSFFSCTPENVFLSSLAQSGGKWIVRLYETYGEASSVHLQLPRGFSSAQETDFNGKPLPRKIELAGKAVSFDISPWEIVTLELAY